MGEYLLGIDIGTDSSRALIFDKRGKTIASSQVSQSVICTRPGYACQNPQQWWEAVVYNCRSVLAQTNIKPSEIAAIGVCGQMHAPVPMRGMELIPGYVQLWCDKRAEEYCDALNKEEGEILLNKTGNRPLPSWTGFKIKWVKINQPDVYGEATKFLSAKDFINFKLTGVQCTDLSEASGTALLDIQTFRWSHEIAELLGLEIDKLPDIVPSTQVIGKVTKAAAIETGLVEGIPVVAGGGDMACLLLGAGLTRVGRACDVAGTACDISVFVTEPCVDYRLMNLYHVVPGWFTFGILDSGGSSYKWVRELVSGSLTDGRDTNRGLDYDELNRLAEVVGPGADGLIYLPYLMGERTLGSAYSRGVFFGLYLGHRAGHLARAVIEGITYDLKQSFEIIRSHGVHIEEVRFVGGGARSPLWGQIKADIYDCPVVAVEQFEGGALGAAILAGAGVGMFKDPAEAAEEMIKVRWQFRPDPERARIYKSYYSLFKRLHDLLQPLFTELHSLQSKGLA
ncbi:MAG: hypothetical protein IMW96_05095 [Thermoanaerobacteraceae bacterium]|nr:hypothetical protein [Thermoanaerobacteraceae bacterium]